MNFLFDVHTLYTVKHWIWGHATSRAHPSNIVPCSSHLSLVEGGEPLIIV